MQLIVAEKPSVARDLARVLGVRPSGRNCFEGPRCTITWCIGHLVELEEPAAYDARWRAWRLDALPMLPEPFKLRASKGTVDQLRVVAGLLRDRRFTAVVNACDAGREGELIFRYVYQYAGGGPPVQRLWISSLTDDAIRRGFASLRPGGQLDPLGDAARSRSEADWLVGMNATRAVTTRGRSAGHEALYSIGRVQTPTLAMLVERERAIRRFVPRPYWEIRGDFTTPAGERFATTWRSPVPLTARVGTAAIAQAIVARDTSHGRGVVERVRARDVREPPPLLFDLTSLQRTANRRFGFSAARTLELAQALYERHKLVTYPRTDSRHLSTDVVADLPRMFGALANVPEYAAFAGELIATPPQPGRRIVDDAKVSDHHAIVVTGNPIRLAALDRDEQRLFDLIARRFLAAFFPDAEFAVTEAWIRVGPADRGAPAFPSEQKKPREAIASAAGRTPGEVPILDVLPPEPDRYLARGRVRRVAGWQTVAGIEPAVRPVTEISDSDDEAASLPPLVEGHVVAGAFASVEKRTTPPPRHTEATLLSAMESAGKIIDDEALRAAMKDRGLGTPATRASIIETLLRRAYIERDRQQLVPTAMGIGLIDALPVASLASPELTGAWEARLARIARGEDTRAAFMADIARYVVEMVNAVRAAPPPPPPPPGVVQAAPKGQSGRGRWRKTGGSAAKPARGPSAATPARGPGAATTSRPKRAHRKADRERAPDRRPRPTPTTPRFVEQAGGDAPPWNHTSPPIARGDRFTIDDREARAFADVAAAFQAGDPADARPASALAEAPRSAPVAPRKPRPPAPGELTCPRCRAGTLLAGARGWGCARWREGCRFVVWFETAGRRITPAQLRDLVTRGKTRKATFDPDRSGARAGHLVLVADADGGAARFEPIKD